MCQTVESLKFQVYNKTYFAVFSGEDLNTRGEI